MKLLKPTWVTHDDLPIFSIDIHPDGSRFATGGQGDDSGRIVIWNMAPVVNADVEDDVNVPKMLCQMDNHLACVNCVRWSFSGKYLASGGDDKLIMIWKISKYTNGGTVFGGGGKVNVESWRCAGTLRGHDGDVLDMAWSPHDAWLATCSVDNSVIVWNTLKMPERVAVLKGHTGLVKGVTWDPVGKFLASQSDDKTLRVWRTADWKEETVAKDPFENCSGTTHVLRPGWSPDGLYLVSAHAMNGGGPVAQIIDRDQWKEAMDFVGHRKAVTCVRFNSNILVKHTKASTKPQQYCCCAIGSRDCSLSIWSTALKRPIVAILDLFDHSVLDITWSSLGRQLMACSWDGSVAYIEFTEDELGKNVPSEEKMAVHERLYGKCLQTSAVVESPEFFQVYGEEKPVKPEVKEIPVAPSTPVKGPINKQIETRTSDGKRRITPMYIPPAPDTDNGPEPFSAAGPAQPTFSSSSETKSRIVIEKRDDIVVPNVSGASCSLPEAPQKGSPAKQANGLQLEVIKAPAPKRPDKDAHVRAPHAKRPRIADKPPAAVAAAPSRHIVESESVLRLPALAPVKTTQVALPGRRRLDVFNEAHGNITKIRVSGAMNDGLSSDWEAVIGSPVCSAVANGRVVAVACSDTTLHVFDCATGVRPLPPLVLKAPAARLAVSAPALVMAITTSGHVGVWDIAKGKVLVRGESLLPVLQQQAASVTIQSCALTDQGCPTISLTSGKAYMFSIDLETWLVLGDSTDPVLRSSMHSSFLPQASGSSNLPLAKLQGNQKPARSAITSGSSLGTLCTLSYLERQLSSCKALNSRTEYKHWFLNLARFLVDQCLETRLRDLCDDLLGPANAATKRTWDATLMGFSKHALLKEVLDAVRVNLNLQRLYTEYKEQLSDK